MFAFEQNRFGRVALFAALNLIGVMACPAYLPAGSMRLNTPVQNRGTISFTLRNERAFQNGEGVKKTNFPFLNIPGLAEASIQQTNKSVSLQWKCEGGPNFQGLVPEFPGPGTWFVQVTWDAAQGLFDVYLNGAAATTPGVKFQPWSVPKPAHEVATFPGPLSVSDLQAELVFRKPEEAEAKTPAELRGRHAELFGQAAMPTPIKVESRKGRLLLDAALANEGDVKGWIMEGPGKAEFAEGWMKMWSTRPDAKPPANGHIVFWCPKDFPERFVCEWDCQIVSPEGLNIIFFAAKGENGEDIFDPRLPQRDGTFVQYTNGKIVCYHISYYANTPDTPGRATSNLRKDHAFYLMATGPVAIPAGSSRIHHLRLIKDRGHIQALVDGKVFIDYTDRGGDRYGPIYTDGKIGLRQMQWTAARYRNLKIWELK